ncbi:MAG: FGGY-family carbohydrate kinase, partial [Verrucomicrobia bacterium]|nr:FGGY-family carbohydrate kinase [Verrucomicrobiota bacterium]
MFLPHMSGSTIPVVDPKSKGAFLGLRNSTTKGDMARAILEGLNYQFMEILDGLEMATGVPMQHLVAVGGGAGHAWSTQNKADMAGQAVEVPEIE